MKVRETEKKVQKQKIKKKPIDKSKKEQVLIVAQEFKFARLLSGNEKKTRDRVLKSLKRWLQSCFDKGHEFKEDDFIRIWKGLFYAVWMSDKPLVQEELCESIAELLDIFPVEQLKYALMMTKAGLKVLATEWYGIDQHRMDKFLMLVRRYARGSLRCVLRAGWTAPSCQLYASMLSASDGILCVKTPQYAKNASSMILHFIDCYLEEIAKVSKGEIPEDSLAALLHPLTSLVCGGEALALCIAARRSLTTLLRQSEIGLQYEEATRAWQKMGCPAGGPEALELMSDDDGDNEAMEEDHHREPPSALDPRAGRVNVFLPLLPVPASQLADQLRKLMSKASSKAFKRASICLKRFEALSKNEYPLVVKEIGGAESPPPAEPEQLAESLVSLEKRLVAESDELALRGLKRKHRKRLLAKSRAGLSIIEDVATLTDRQADSTDGSWQVETTEPVEKSNQNCSKNGNEVIKKKSRKRKLKENPENKAKKAKAEGIKNINLSNGKDVVNVNKPKVKLTAKQVAKHCGMLNKEESKGVNEEKKRENNGVSEKQANTSVSDKVKKKKAELNAVKMNGHGNKIKKTNNKTEKIALNSPKLIGLHTQKKGNTKSIVLVDKENKKTTDGKVKTEATKVDIKPKTRQKVLLMNKIKNYQKQVSLRNGQEVQKKGNKNSPKKVTLETPKKVKFVLKNNGMQAPVDYYKSVRQSPSIPFDSSKKPTKTNLKPSTPSPINPFFKKKLRLRS